MNFRSNRGSKKCLLYQYYNCKRILTYRPTGKSLMVIWRMTPCGSIIKSPLRVIPWSSKRTPYDREISKNTLSIYFIADKISSRFFDYLWSNQKQEECSFFLGHLLFLEFWSKPNEWNENQPRHQWLQLQSCGILQLDHFNII